MSETLDPGPTTDFSASSFQSEPTASMGGDAELQRILMREQQRAQFQAMVHKFNDICWDTCIDKPSSKLDGKTETCIVNCVNRFIDLNLSMAQRFAQMLQSGGM